MELNQKTKILMISHFSLKDDEKGEQFPGSIKIFLLGKVGRVVYIDHPFIKSQGISSDFISSQMRIYDNGVKKYQLTSPKLKLPALILFIYQLFLTIFFVSWKPMRYDLCIACDNLSLISVFIFRKLGFIKKIIYYTVDYSPERYSNRLLNNLYQNMDRLSNMISDVNWVAVENMITAKEKNGLDLKKCAPFQVVQMGFNKENIFVKPSKQTDRFNLIFVGYLFEKQGLQLVIEIFSTLIKKFPKVHLTIVGSGPMENQLRSRVKVLDLSSYITFTGHINNHPKIVDILTKSGGIGLAPYIPSIGDYTYFADPSKIKLYLLCGLPVITTAVPPIAKKIKEHKAGIVVDYTPKELLNALEYLMKDSKIYLNLRKNALEISKNYDTNFILDKAFKELP